MKEVRVMKSTLVFIALSSSILLGLYSLSSGKHPPSIPKDLFHESVLNDSACITFPIPDAQAALRKTYTLKMDCMTCHKGVTTKLI